MILHFQIDRIASNVANQQQKEHKKKFYAESDVSSSSRSSSIQSLPRNISPSPSNLEFSDSVLRRRGSFQSKLSGFMSPYFMAFHWRLWSVTLSLIATIIAVPMTTMNDGLILRLSVFVQYFIRFLVLSASSWLLVFVLFSIGIGIYGRFSTADVMDDTIEYKEGELNQMEESMMRCLRLFCLMDSFGIKDKNRCWRRFKIAVLSMTAVCGVILLILYAILGDGSLWFSGLSHMYRVCKSSFPERGWWYLQRLVC